MSQLGKILLYVAAAGGLAALIAGGLLVKKRGEEAVVLQKAQEDKILSDQATKKAQAETKAIQQAKDDQDKALAEAQTKVSDLTSQADDLKKKADTATAAVQAATDSAKAAQDKLDALNKTLNGKSPQDYIDQVTKAQADLAAAQSEEKILQDQADAYKTQVATTMEALNNSKHGGQMPGVSGKVTFVDHAWNFVILNVGLSAGVVPNGELIVYRGRTFLGKIRVTKVDPNDAVAEILPDVKGDIQIGDAVLN
jgi:hypothetical protein